MHYKFYPIDQKSDKHQAEFFVQQIFKLLDFA